MKDFLDLSPDLRAAAATLESSLIRRLADGGSMGVRIHAPEGLEFDPACILAAALANASDLLQLLPHARGVLALPFETLQTLGARALTAATQAAGLEPASMTIELDEAGLAGAGAAGLSLAEGLKARGFRLQLNCAPSAPLGLDQRARALFSSAQAPAADAIAALTEETNVWAQPMARRIVASKAAGLELIAHNADESQNAELRRLGFTGASYAGDANAA
jgi:hypothetical protein